MKILLLMECSHQALVLKGIGIVYTLQKVETTIIRYYCSSIRLVGNLKANFVSKAIAART